MYIVPSPFSAWIIHDLPYFVRISMNTIPVNDVSKERHLPLEKLALLRFQLQVHLLQRVSRYHLFSSPKRTVMPTPTDFSALYLFLQGFFVIWTPGEPPIGTGLIFCFIGGWSPVSILCNIRSAWVSSELFIAKTSLYALIRCNISADCSQFFELPWLILLTGFAFFGLQLQNIWNRFQPFAAEPFSFSNSPITCPFWGIIGSTVSLMIGIVVLLHQTSQTLSAIILLLDRNTLGCIPLIHATDLLSSQRHKSYFATARMDFFYCSHLSTVSSDHPDLASA